MFAVMQKGDELKPCYSDSDFKYLQARGWSDSKMENSRRFSGSSFPDFSETQGETFNRVISTTVKKRGRPILKLNKQCQSPITQS